MHSKELIASRIAATKKQLLEIMQNRIFGQPNTNMNEIDRLRMENAQLKLQMQEFCIETLRSFDYLQKLLAQSDSPSIPNTNQVELLPRQSSESLLSTAAVTQPLSVRTPAKPIPTNNQVVPIPDAEILGPYLLATEEMGQMIGNRSAKPKPRKYHAKPLSLPSSANSLPTSALSSTHSVGITVNINKQNPQLKDIVAQPTKMKPPNLIAVVKYIQTTTQGIMFSSVKLRFLNDDAARIFLEDFANYVKNSVVIPQIQWLCSSFTELNADIVKDTALYRESQKNPTSTGNLILDELQKHINITLVKTVFFNSDTLKEITADKAEVLLKNDNNHQPQTRTMQLTP